jgi:MFS family permease
MFTFISNYFNRYIDLLRREPGFRNLWLASVVSRAGDWFNTIASVIIVNRYTDSGLAVSAVLIARLLPVVLVGPLAGVVADRFNRKTVMVVADLLRAGIVLSFLLVDRPERVWLIYLLTVLQFIVSTFFEPASNAILPALVSGRKDLTTANVLRSVTWSIMLALGSAVGGLFTAAFGAEAALVVDSLSYLFSVFFLLRVPFEKAADVAVAAEFSGWKDLIDGFKFVWGRPFLLTLVLVKLFGQLGNGDIIAAVYAERYFPLGKEGAGALGLMMAMMGIGAILGPIFVNLFFNESEGGLKNTLLFGFIIVPFGWLLMGVGPGLALVSSGFLVRMIGVSANWTFSNVLIQMKAPENFLGRIFALDLGLFTLASVFSIFLSGWFMDEFGVSPRVISLGFGAASILPIGLWLGVLSWQRGREDPVPAD